MRFAVFVPGDTLDDLATDRSGMGQGCDRRIEFDKEDEEEEPYGNRHLNEAVVDGAYLVRKLPMSYLKRKLIEHFNILRQQHKLECQNGQGTFGRCRYRTKHSVIN